MAICVEAGGCCIVRDLVRAEWNRRKQIYGELKKEHPELTNIQPDRLRELRVYGGQQGIYYDKENTSVIFGGKSGVTVSVLHTGRHYPDDLSDTHIIYHYPDTKRSGHDEKEVLATKNAGELGMPIFVITYSSKNLALRDVFIGLVQDWCDDSKMFLISLTKDWVELAAHDERINEEELPFKLEIQRGRKCLSRNMWPNNPDLFRFSVFKRYGAKCAVCSVSRSEMLQAAHLRPVSEKGSDDPRNGLVLCANHQLAINACLFAFDPESLDIVLKPGVTAEELGITVNSLRELSNKPHPEALAWRYGFWKRNMGFR